MSLRFWRQLSWLSWTNNQSFFFSYFYNMCPEEMTIYWLLFFKKNWGSSIGWKLSPRQFSLLRVFGLANREVGEMFHYFIFWRCKQGGSIWCGREATWGDAERFCWAITWEGGLSLPSSWKSTSPPPSRPHNTGVVRAKLVRSGDTWERKLMIVIISTFFLPSLNFFTQKSEACVAFSLLGYVINWL